MDMAADQRLHLPGRPHHGLQPADPFVMLNIQMLGHAEALRSLRAIYVDSGTKDEWYLDLGAEAFRRALAEIGVTDVHFELFEAGHMGIEYRYPLSLRYLAERLAPKAS